MSASSPAPGWYPDPAGGGSRWWDGRAWTQYRSGGPATIVQPPLPEGVSTGTPWIYLQALLPLVQVVVQLPYLLSFGSLYSSQLALMSGGSAELSDSAVRTLLTQYAGLLGVFALTSAFSLLASAAWVVFSALDARRLQRVGIVQPFHWAWSFLGIVYPIGRAVVLRRRIGRGARPIWLLVTTFILSTGAIVAIEVAVLLPTFLTFVSTAAHEGAVS
jgi:hypothetical protein